MGREGGWFHLEVAHCSESLSESQARPHDQHVFGLDNR